MEVAGERVLDIGELRGGSLDVAGSRRTNVGRAVIHEERRTSLELA